MKKGLYAFIIVFLTMVLFSCSAKSSNDHTIIMGTTTSTDNSGLLQYLIPYFTKETGITVKWVAVGTGAALQMGRDKQADILMVHDKPDELQFMTDGYGIMRSDLMHNDFVVVGPKDSTIDNSSLQSVFAAIYNHPYTFISRGDHSGTNAEELRIWNEYSLQPSGSWYISDGEGMGATLTMASEKQAYTLSDRSTFLSMENQLNLKIVYENNDVLRNQYGIIVVTPNVNNKGNYTDAVIFYNWLLSPHGQYLIDQFGKDTFGQQLFFGDSPIKND